MNDRIQKMKEIAGILKEDTVSKREVVSLFRALVESVKRAREDATREGKQNTSHIFATVDKMLGDALSKMEENSKTRDDMMEKRTGGAVEECKKLVADAIAEMRRMLPKGVDLSGVEKEITELAEDILLVKRQIPALDTATQIRNKLESLDGSERLDMSAIDGLLEALEKIRKTSTPRRVGIIGGRVSHIPLVDVFTGDGSTKTFYLSKAPRDMYTIKAWGSDFPHILTHDDGNGFTVSGKALTLDSDTDAPSLGARFVVEYYV